MNVLNAKIEINVYGQDRRFRFNCLITMEKKRVQVFGRLYPLITTNKPNYQTKKGKCYLPLVQPNLISFFKSLSHIQYMHSCTIAIYSTTTKKRRFVYISGKRIYLQININRFDAWDGAPTSQTFFQAKTTIRKQTHALLHSVYGEHTVSLIKHDGLNYISRPFPMYNSN